MALKGGEQARHLEAEGDWHCLLQVGAGRHRRRAMLLCKLLRGRNGAVEILGDQVERSLDLQDGGRVRDVLGGRPPMAVLASISPAQTRDLVDKAKHWVADG